MEIERVERARITEEMLDQMEKEATDNEEVARARMQRIKENMLEIGDDLKQDLIDARERCAKLQESLVASKNETETLSKSLSPYLSFF